MAAPQHDISKYTIGWLCALPIELAASRLVLDRIHQGHWADPAEGIQYTLGSIGSHNVVIGCLPVGEKGIGAAATIAARMRVRFPNMKFGLMVGIGGGIPTKADVRLGDVVVSQPVDSSPSVVQYDMGHDTPRGFVRTGFLNAPPQMLRQALANLQARHICDTNNMPRYIAVLEQKKIFKKPPPETDILFESTYDHDQDETTCDNCDNCDKSKIKPREPRDDNEVVVHYGTIASGNRVMKNARTRDRLSNEPGKVLCFDMEAAGLMNNFDCLVIRGIADYADSHKNDRWQPYAAAVAAAFAKDLLVDIPPITSPNISFLSIWIEERFKSAQADLLLLSRDLEIANSIDCQSVLDVYTAADGIQKLQAPRGELRALGRIDPYIKNVHELVEVIETLTSISKDSLMIIWSSFKLLLEVFGLMEYAFADIVYALADVGRDIPHFKEHVELLNRNEDVKDVLGLFYREIVDLHLVILRTFKKKNTKLVFQSYWPRTKRMIKFFKENMGRYKNLLSEHVTTDQITQEYDTRHLAYDAMQDEDKLNGYKDYETARTYIAPHFYEGELIKFQRGINPHSGNWLHENDDFKRWLDADDLTMRTLWLQGIPGAGKTVLVANSINRMRQADAQVLFAFLTFDDKEEEHAVKVLQSLMFQMTNRNPHMWPILHERYLMDAGKLKSNSQYLEELFTELLKDAGQTFIIIDGVDEVNQIDRAFLLKSLMRAKQSCKNVKLLISSRLETDIARDLEKRAVSIRVDHRNAEDIETYVDLEVDEWLPRLVGYGASESTSSQIKTVLAGLKEKAKGMFLYAKLVMHIVKTQDNLEDIRTETENIPSGLEQAYGRILQGIQKRERKDGLAAITILQWIGCATHPLREQELLQILAIQQPGSDNFLRGRQVFRNIRETCGPFIEIEKGIVQFVHFTAREYLFGDQSKYFIRSADTHWLIALTCLNYLCFESLNEIFFQDTNKKEIRQKILEGDFIIFQYAASQWIHHVRKCAREIEPHYLQSLCEIINEFYGLRGNKRSTADTPQRLACLDFASFGKWPDVQRFLALIQDFQYKLEIGHLHTDDKESIWTDRDPTKISAALVQLRGQIEALLCQGYDHLSNCYCETVQVLYGTNLYRCDRQFCQFYSTGFATRKERDMHLKVHSRPHLCPYTDCIFTELGFKSLAELTRHCEQAHPPQRCIESRMLSARLSQQVPKNDVIALLEYAIRHNDTATVLYLLENFEYPPDRYCDLQQIAASHASGNIVKCILDHAGPFMRKRDIEDLVLDAIRGENMSALQYLLTPAYEAAVQKYVDTSTTGFVFKQRLLCAFGIGNADIMEILMNDGRMELPSTCPQDLFWGLIHSKRDDIDKLRRLRSIKKYVIWPKAFTNAVYWAALSGSMMLVQGFLDCGGSANAFAYDKYKSPRRSPRSALYECVQRGSNRHAEVVKLLLQNGADPSAEGLTRLKRMAKIESYFGMSWKDLVIQTQGRTVTQNTS